MCLTYTKSRIYSAYLAQRNHRLNVLLFLLRLFSVPDCLLCLTCTHILGPAALNMIDAARNVLDNFSVHLQSNFAIVLITPSATTGSSRCAHWQ